MTALSYDAFIAAKAALAAPTGFAPDASCFPSAMFPYQCDLATWAVRRGRAAIFARYGLGKTIMQLTWADQVQRHTGSAVLILAPLAVARQTAAEGERFGIAVQVVTDGSQVGPEGIYVTNYERLHRFDPSVFAGVVLDESSILKASDGKTRKLITEAFRATPYKLACTATPAPNDHMELGTHAEFLGILTATEMLAEFFTHDGGDTSKWVLRKHGARDFWRWVASWAALVRRPSDLGYDDTAYALPPLYFHQHEVAVEHQELAPVGAQLALFAIEAQTLSERRNARKLSLADRVARAADLANASKEPWAVWCNLNDESKALAAAIPGAVEVTGSDTLAHKEQAAADFVSGKARVIVSKPSIFGFGVNWQHCCNAAFVGLSDSFEELDQAIHRFYRFGQRKPVHIHIITSELEGSVVRNIERKRQANERMADQMARYTADYVRANVCGAGRTSINYTPGQAMIVPDWCISEVEV